MQNEQAPRQVIARFKADYLPMLNEFRAVSDPRYYLHGFHVEPAPGWQRPPGPWELHESGAIVGAKNDTSR